MTTVVDAKYVELLGRAFSFGGTQALLELTDDGRVILSTIDGKTGQRAATVIDSYAGDLRVRGSNSILTIGANGVRRRLDFAADWRGLAAFGLVGAIANAAIARNEGIVDWANRLKAAGADVKFITGGKSAVRILIITGAIIVALALFLTITTLLAAIQR
jgi:hypothetical protein